MRAIFPRSNQHRGYRPHGGLLQSENMPSAVPRFIFNKKHTIHGLLPILKLEQPLV